MEFLKEVLGDKYTEFEQLMKAYNENPDNEGKQIKIGNLASGQYVDKGKYETLSNEKGNLEEQINTLTATVNTLKNGNKDNEELQNTIKQLNTDIAALKTESANTAKTYALKEQLSKSGVLDPDYLIYKAGGIDKFTFDKENAPVGVGDVIKSYKEDKSMAHLFAAEEKKPPYNPTNGNSGNTGNPFAKETFNLTKQGELLKSNPEQAKAMAASAGVTI